MKEFPDYVDWKDAESKLEFRGWAWQEKKDIPRSVDGPFRFWKSGSQMKLRHWTGWYMFLPPEIFEKWFQVFESRRIQ